MKKIDNIVIVGDRDFYSWMGLEYNNSSLDKNIFFQNVSQENSQGNIFIEKVILHKQETTYNVWQVHLARTNATKDQSGLISLSYDSFELANSSWLIPKDQSKHIINLRSSRTEKISEEMLRWEIFPKETDAILLDNVFYTPLGSGYHSVTLYSSLEGENPFEDPARDLITVFNSLGFFVERYDQEKPPKSSANIDVFMISDDFSSESSLEDISEINQELWVAPRYSKVSPIKICEFLVKAKALKKAVSYGYICETMKTQSDFTLMLGSEGYEQIGGSLGKSQEALRGKRKTLEKYYCFYISFEK